MRHRMTWTPGIVSGEQEKRMEHIPDFTWRNHKVESRIHVTVYLVLAAIQA